MPSRTPPTLGNWNKLVESRKGCMIHYDDSASDTGAVNWLTKDERCKVSYNELILDNGRVIQIAPEEARAWHAGVCKPSDERLFYKDANSAFYGTCIAAGSKDRATDAQIESVAKSFLAKFKKNNWDTQTELWHIKSHRTEAWPRGRKVDCEGPNLDRIVLDTQAVRDMVKKLGAPVVVAPPAPVQDPFQPFHIFV